MKADHNRRLAAVLFADVVGYTALSARDEDEALALVGTLQTITDREVTAVDGRVVKYVGDAALAVFESTEGAVRAALALREGFSASPIARRNSSALRIGIHIGEIAHASDGDVYGDGVNAAARIQGAAEPGQILLSDTAYEQVGHRGEFSLVEVGTRQLKGLRRALKLYALSQTEEKATGDGPETREARPTTRAGRRISRGRAVAIGMLGGLATLFGYGVFAGMGEGDEENGGGLPNLPTSADLEVELNLGIEAYYAGSPEAASGHLDAFLLGTGSTDLGRRGLRYLSRSLVESDLPDSARVALHALMDQEPPIALLIPALESDSLLELYYEVRRERMSRTGMEDPSLEISGAVIFDFQVLIPDPEAAAAAREGRFGSGVARMLETDLLNAGIEVMRLEEMSFYGRGDDAYRDLDAVLGSAGSERPSHAVIGSLAIREERALLSAWVFEIDTGRLVSAQQAGGTLSELFDLPRVIARGIVSDTGSGAAG